MPAKKAKSKSGSKKSSKKPAKKKLKNVPFWIGFDLGGTKMMASAST